MGPGPWQSGGVAVVTDEGAEDAAGQGPGLGAPLVDVVLGAGGDVKWGNKEKGRGGGRRRGGGKEKRRGGILRDKGAAMPALGWRCKNQMEVSPKALSAPWTLFEEMDDSFFPLLEVNPTTQTFFKQDQPRDS